MYKKITPLKFEDHKSLRLLSVNEYSFARDEILAPIVIDEIADVAREYPVVYPVGSRLPVAMMGVEKGANAYVGNDGKWLATYIPAHIRHYPMAITRMARSPESQGKQGDQNLYVVLVDMASPFVNDKEGDPLFDSNGKITGPAQRTLRSMEQMQNRVGVTQRLVRALEDAGLLIERSIRIKRVGQADRQLAGVRVINEAALNKLDDAAFNKLRATGALPLVYASLLSWANFRQGPIGKSHPLPPTLMTTPTATATAMTDDVIRF